MSDISGGDRPVPAMSDLFEDDSSVPESPSAMLTGYSDVEAIDDEGINADDPLFKQLAENREHWLSLDQRPMDPAERTIQQALGALEFAETSFIPVDEPEEGPMDFAAQSARTLKQATEVFDLEPDEEGNLDGQRIREAIHRANTRLSNLRLSLQNFNMLSGAVDENASESELSLLSRLACVLENMRRYSNALLTVATAPACIRDYGVEELKGMFGSTLTESQIDLEKVKTAAKKKEILYDYLASCLRKENAGYYRGNVYTRAMVELNGLRWAHSWRHKCTLMDYMKHITSNEYITTNGEIVDGVQKKPPFADYVQRLWLYTFGSQGAREEICNAMESAVYPGIVYIHYERNYFACRNVVIDAHNCRWWRHDDANCPGITCERFFDVTVDEAMLADPNWRAHRPMDLYKLLEPQIKLQLQKCNKLSQEELDYTFEVMAALVMRIKFPVQLDKWQAALMYIGGSNTGKSTLMELIEHLFNPGDLGKASNQCEEAFPWGPYTKSLAIRFDEIGRGFNWPMAEMKLAISGLSFNVRVKNGSQVPMDPWHAPLCFFGQHMPDVNADKGAVEKRWMLFFADHKFYGDSVDMGLATRMRDSVMQIIWYGSNAYKAMREDMTTEDADGRKFMCDIWGSRNYCGKQRSALPLVFHVNKQVLSKSLDPFAEFYTAGTWVIKAPTGAGIPLEELKKLWKQYLEANDLDKHCKLLSQDGVSALQAIGGGQMTLQSTTVLGTRSYTPGTAWVKGIAIAPGRMGGPAPGASSSSSSSSSSLRQASNSSSASGSKRRADSPVESPNAAAEKRSAAVVSPAFGFDDNDFALA